MGTILKLEHITKTFGPVVANHDISVDIGEGTIHCFLGENGSGKSTLMNVITGLHRPDEGKIIVRGQPALIRSPKDAMSYQIGMVHQHFMLFNQNTVLENIIIGEEKTSFILRPADHRRALEELLRKYGFSLNLDAKIRDLSVGEKQRVEILRVLYRGADIIIFDEPTAVLTPQEADQLMEIFRSLKAAGKTVIFISHKLKEILSVGDRITVIRRGRVVFDGDIGDATPEKLAFEMVGHKTQFSGFERAACNPGKPLFRIKNAVLREGRPGISFEARAGEIVGIAGVDGNGQMELEQLIVGLTIQNGCFTEIAGEDVSSKPPLSRKLRGLAYIPSDRLENGIMVSLPLTDNYLLGNQSRAEFQKHGILKTPSLNAYAAGAIEQYDVRTPGVDVSAGSLSGGNQQKMVLSRELSHDPCVILAAQPTRGLDIGAIEFVHKTLLRERDKGNTVILISTELSEIQELSDRIIVLYEGEITKEGPTAMFSQEDLGLYMAGKRGDQT